MPRYYFDTDDGEIDRDEVGVVLPDDETARAEAIRYLGALLVDIPGHLSSDRSFSTSVRNELGGIVARIEVDDRGQAN